MSDYEPLTASETNTPVPYNGFITFFYSRAGSAIRTIYVNDVEIGGISTPFSDEYMSKQAVTIVVKKGDLVRSGTSGMLLHARWFKTTKDSVNFIIKY